MAKKRSSETGTRAGETPAPAEVVPTPAESWKRHVRIHELLENVREGRRRSRTQPTPVPPK